MITADDQANLKRFLERVRKVAPFSEIDIMTMSYGTQGFLLGAFRNNAALCIGLHLQDARRTVTIDERAICDDLTSLAFWPAGLSAAPRQASWVSGVKFSPPLR